MSDYGALSLGSDAQDATNYPHGTYSGSRDPHVIEWFGALNADQDQFDLQLWAHYGGFGSQGEIRPGTYPITGDELDIQKCGICPAILPDVTQNTTTLTELYMPTGGSVTITSAGTNGAGTLSGSFTNLTFAHYLIQNNMLVMATDGCTSTIASGTFSAPLGGSAGLFQGKGTKPLFLAHRYY